MSNEQEQTVEALVEGVTKIANSPRLVSLVEANVCYHDTIKTHQTRRVLLAYAMLVGENKNERQATETKET